MTTLGHARPRTDSLAWLDQAACKGKHELFHPGVGEVPTEAKAICRSCPVIGRCLEDALAQPYIEDHGVRGGYSRQERKVIRQKRRIAT